MGEIYDRQKRQEDMQRSKEFVDVFSKIVSGKAGYKTSIDVKPIVTKCKKCGATMNQEQKFCHECGKKVWIKPEKCPKCSKKISNDEKFCGDCGESLEEPE